MKSIEHCRKKIGNLKFTFTFGKMDHDYPNKDKYSCIMIKQNFISYSKDKNYEYILLPEFILERIIPDYFLKNYSHWYKMHIKLLILEIHYNFL